MSENKNDPPFQREAQVDKPGIIGAKWWHASLVDEEAKVARRKAIKQILVGGAVVAGLGLMLTWCAKKVASPSTYVPTDPTPIAPPFEAQEGRKTALDMQQDYGWSFGANGEALVFDGTSETAFDPDARAKLATVMKPSEIQLVPYYQATLFTATEATPKKTLDDEDLKAFKPLYPQLAPKVTPAMRVAYARGKSMAALFAALAPAAKVSLIVDLPGREAVAFAAGAAHLFAPVCLFDNWPHPRGVVKAHETLAAALYYEPLFDKEQRDTTAKKAKRLPMFVLDRNRIASYTDESTEFDNRYVAKLPWPGTAMKALGVERVLYIVPGVLDATRELDDLNDDFVAYKKDGVDVKIVPLDRFTVHDPSTSTDGGVEAGALATTTKDAGADAGVAVTDIYYYGGDAKSQWSFFDHYPVAKNPHPSATSDIYTPPGAGYDAAPRVSTFSSGVVGGSSVKPTPASFATVPRHPRGGNGRADWISIFAIRPLGIVESL